MNRDFDGLHAKQVDAWIEQTLVSLPLAQQVRLFERAIQAIQKRILVTLSTVTLNAILERVLYESQQKFPLLTGIKLEPVGISLNGLLPEGKNQNLGLDPKAQLQFTEAVRFFLIELMTVLENLTAGILTKPLYNDLYQVTTNFNTERSSAFSTESERTHD